MFSQSTTQPSTFSSWFNLSHRSLRTTGAFAANMLTLWTELCPRFSQSTNIPSRPIPGSFERPLDRINRPDLRHLQDRKLGLGSPEKRGIVLGCLSMHRYGPFPRCTWMPQDELTLQRKLPVTRLMTTLIIVKASSKAYETGNFNSTSSR